MAIGGLHVVTLAWDFVPGQDARRNGLLGFAIERSQLANGAVVERYYLRGIKRFSACLSQAKSLAVWRSSWSPACC